MKKPYCAPGLIDKYCNGKIDELLMYALWQIDRKDPHKPFTVSPQHIAMAEAAELYMQKNFSEFINYRILSREVGINISYLKVAFQQRFGKTMDVYLRRLRMDAACALFLSSPNQSIESIGFDVGYTIRKAFSRAFLQEFGCSPQVFRKLNIK